MVYELNTFKRIKKFIYEFVYQQKKEKAKIKDLQQYFIGGLH
jgi:hypothetical protein